MPEAPSIKAKRAHIGRVSRSGDAAQLAKARADYYEAKLADAIERIVTRAPALSDEQVARLAALLPALLRPGGVSVRAPAPTGRALPDTGPDAGASSAAPDQR